MEYENSVIKRLRSLTIFNLEMDNKHHNQGHNRYVGY